MSFLSDSINFILPYKCDICGGNALKADNLPSFIPQSIHICSSCLSSISPVDEDRRWLLCLSQPYMGDIYPDLPLYLPFIYNDVMSRIIKKLKFNQQKDMGVFVGRLLGNLMLSDGISKDSGYTMIVPIPLSDERLKERGYNQAEVIAGEIARVLNIPIFPDVLKRVKNTNRQAKINDDTLRSINVSGAFALNQDWSVDNTRIILVDDVVTSGNTMHEAAVILKENDCKEILCAAVCGNRNAKNEIPY